MAETVLSMARSMLGGAISKAASAAADEMSLLMGVRKDIWYVHMHFFCCCLALPTASYILFFLLLRTSCWMNIS